MRNLPASWRLRQDLGFFHHIYLKDSQRAAAILLEAAEIPGAAFWLRTLAADLLAKGGDRAASRRMWTQMYEQAEAGIIRENARLRLQILDSLDAADRLTERGGRVREAPRAPPGPARGAARSGAVGRAAGRRGRVTVRL